MSLTSLALAGGFFTTSATWEAPLFTWDVSFISGSHLECENRPQNTCLLTCSKSMCLYYRTIISVLEWLLCFYNLKAVLFFPFLSGGRANTKKSDTAKPGIFGGSSRGSQCRTWIFLLSPFFSYSKLSLIPDFKGGFLFPHCLIHSLSKSALPPDFSPVHLLLSPA